MRRLALLSLVSALAATAQAITVSELVEKNKATVAGIRDFTCIMSFTVHSQSVRVPDSRAQVLFKMPDKFKAKPLDGDFAVLPRTWRFAMGNVLGRLSQTHTLTLLRTEKLGARDFYVVKAEPNEGQADKYAKYHLVWVDTEYYTVGALRSYLAEGKPVTMTIAYLKHDQAFLPSSIDVDATIKKDDEEEAVHASLKLSKYEVNVGLTDDQFKDDAPRR